MPVFPNFNIWPYDADEEPEPPMTFNVLDEANKYIPKDGAFHQVSVKVKMEVWIDGHYIESKEVNMGYYALGADTITDGLLVTTPPKNQPQVIKLPARRLEV
jgi:hypothetical protein